MLNLSGFQEYPIAKQYSSEVEGSIIPQNIFLLHFKTISYLMHVS